MAFRAQTKDADVIVLCSDVQNISPDSLALFISDTFPQRAIPRIVEGNGFTPIEGAKAVYFYFGFSEKAGADFRVSDCLDTFPQLSVSYSQTLGALAEGIGTQPTFLPNAELYGPILTKQKTLVNEDDVIVIYMGLHGSHFPHVLLALQHLLGLPDQYCQSGNVCGEVEEITW